MKRCTRCVLPATKPDLSFDSQGVCSACQNYEARKNIDWDARAREFSELVKPYRNQGPYDCIVPVSGGKDSTYQCVKMLELGLKPLAVTATTCDQSDLGTKNIENLKRLGVDHVQFSPNPLVRRKLNAIGLREVGDISWPEHVGIFTIPVRAAVAYRVPLIIWGENSQNEYGGPAQAAQNKTLTRRWLEEFGGLLGLRVSDLGSFGLSPRDLWPYTYPEDSELSAVGVTGVFLGFYFPWDGRDNARTAMEHGFTPYHEIIEGSSVNYESIDCYQTGAHEFYKWLKYGYSRPTDLASLQVRRGQITREAALSIVERYDGQYPHSYLGKPLKDILAPLGVSIEEFDALCEKFKNKKIHAQN